MQESIATYSQMAINSIGVLLLAEREGKEHQVLFRTKMHAMNQKSHNKIVSCYQNCNPSQNEQTAITVKRQEIVEHQTVQKEINLVSKGDNFSWHPPF